jgi:hypothetical protein
MSDKMMPVTVLNWRPLAKGSLLGFAEIRLGALIITDVTVNQSNGTRWAGLPAKAQIDREGNVRRDNGKILYSKVMQWATKEAGDRFSQSVIAAIMEKYPDALA